ncbi:hypothetical protein ACWCPF_32460 [Streptomyces sp. NPDC001858]
MTSGEHLAQNQVLQQQSGLRASQRSDQFDQRPVGVVRALAAGVVRDDDGRRRGSEGVEQGEGLLELVP